jgi:chromosome partition protein MukE
VSAGGKSGFTLLQDVLLDEDFPELDLALRRGRHVDRDDGPWYALLTDAQEHLEVFYRRYGCELIHKSDGYYYLLPTSDKLPRRQLSVDDMLVGQVLALLYLDPASVERGGVITREDVIAQLASVLGTDALIAAFNPKKKRGRVDERVAQKTVRNKVAEAVRRLGTMGFVEAVEEDRLKLRPALLRFAEPVRGMGAPAEALAKLVASGEVALQAEQGAVGEDEETEAEAETETETETEAETETETEAETETETEAETEAEAEAVAEPVAARRRPLPDDVDEDGFTPSSYDEDEDE